MIDLLIAQLVSGQQEQKNVSLFEIIAKDAPEQFVAPHFKMAIFLLFAWDGCMSHSCSLGGGPLAGGIGYW